MPKFSNMPMMGDGVEVSDDSAQEADEGQAEAEAPSSQSRLWDPNSDYPSAGEELSNAIGIFGSESILGTSEKPLRYSDCYVPTFVVILMREFYIGHRCDIKAFSIKDIAASIKASLLRDGFHISPSCRDDELADGVKGCLDFYGIKYKQ